MESVAVGEGGRLEWSQLLSDRGFLLSAGKRIEGMRNLGDDKKGQKRKGEKKKADRTRYQKSAAETLIHDHFPNLL